MPNRKCLFESTVQMTGGSAGYYSALHGYSWPVKLLN